MYLFWFSSKDNERESFSRGVLEGQKLARHLSSVSASSQLLTLPLLRRHAFLHYYSFGVIIVISPP